MTQIIDARKGEIPSFAADDCKVTPLERAVLERDAPSAHYLCVRDGQFVARCSTWSESTPMDCGRPVGVVGHYAAFDAAAGAAVLNHAAEQLAGRGFHTIVGPMDGNTWRRYRLLTQRGNEPLFFLEPDNPDDWPSHFQAAGFSPLARYVSSLNDDLSVVYPRTAEIMDRLSNAGVHLRHIDPSRFEEELKAVHELSLQSFAGNFLYTPISQEQFLGMYAPLRSHLLPELILLAEKENQLVGFIFGLPDLKQAERKTLVNTAIAKSMAVRPGHTGTGLGGILLDRFQQAARDLGFTRVIHALMHENNNSLKISAHFGRPIRQYTLFAKEAGK